MPRDTDPSSGYHFHNPRHEHGPAGPHVMFEELGRIDQDFNQRYARMRQWQVSSEAQKTVRKYAEVMDRYPRDITAEMLCNPQNMMANNVDPVFVVLARAIGGEECLTRDAWSRIRREWCTDDLPQDLYGILISPDRDFVNEFENFRFRPDRNIKLEALQRTGIVRQLVSGRRA